jgi:hypothetical protein
MSGMLLGSPAGARRPAAGVDSPSVADEARALLAEWKALVGPIERQEAALAALSDSGAALPDIRGPPSRSSTTWSGARAACRSEPWP